MKSLRRIGAVGAIAAAFALTAGATNASAAVGWVETTDFSCDYFVVDAMLGYAVLEWYGGALPYEGMRISGRFESYGFKTVRAGRRSMRVWVEDYWLDRDDAYRTMYSNC